MELRYHNLYNTLPPSVCHLLFFPPVSVWASLGPSFQVSLDQTTFGISLGMLYNTPPHWCPSVLRPGGVWGLPCKPAWTTFLLSRNCAIRFPPVPSELSDVNLGYVWGFFCRTSWTNFGISTNSFPALSFSLGHELCFLPNRSFLTSGDRKGGQGCLGLSVRA